MAQTFTLRGPYIQLSQLLKVLHWSQSGAHSHILIEEAQVLVNGTIATEKRKKIYPGDTVTLDIQSVTILPDPSLPTSP